MKNEITINGIMTDKIKTMGGLKFDSDLFSFFFCEKCSIIPVENKIKAWVIPCAYVRGINNEVMKNIHDDNMMPKEEPIPKIVKTSKYEPSK